MAARQSYLSWPTDRDDDRSAFGFADALGRVVFDARPGQQASLTLLAGTSNVDDEEDDLAPDELGTGTNRTSMVNVAWRSTFGASLVLRQRAYLVRHRFHNTRQSGHPPDRGVDEEIAYRADVVRTVARGLFESGVQVGRVATRDSPGVAGASWERAGYAHFRWAVTSALTLSPGVRVTLIARA